MSPEIDYTEIHDWTTDGITYPPAPEPTPAPSPPKESDA